MSIKEHLNEKKKKRRTGRDILLFLITVGAIFTGLFPIFSIVFFALLFGYLLMEFKYIIEWQTTKVYCDTCKEEHNHA